MMALVPLDRSTGRPRPLSEQDRAKLRREKEKADWNRRNPDSKWKK